MRRNTKTMYEWRKAYRDKEELMLERGFPEVSPHEFYRDLFPEGSLQSAEHDGKGNVIATQIRPSGKGRTKQWVIDDSLNMLDKVIGDEFGLIPPITFYGKTHTKQNAHELYAVAIDIDYVGKQQLKNLLKQFGNGVQLRPTYLVSSGKGVHAYYFLKEPVQLYHNLEDTLAELKEAFIRRLWNDIKDMKKLPDAIFVVDPKKEHICVQEAHTLGIPLIGIVDTNCDPEELDYVIPGNDDAIRAVKLIVSKMADAVIEAKQGEVLEGAMEIEISAEAFEAAEA